jgi:hypothetical protein
MERMRIEAVELVDRLATERHAETVLAAVHALHAGEPVVSIGLGRLKVVRAEHALRLALDACELVRRGAGLVELRSLRRPLRRELLAELAGCEEAIVHAAARRKLVLRPGPDVAMTEIEALSPTRRKMLRLVARDGEHCVWCSTPLTHLSPHATVDHVRCRSHGGGDALDNLVLACAPCNNRRANRPAELWLESCLRAGADVDRAAVRAAIARTTQLPMAA